MSLLCALLSPWRFDHPWTFSLSSSVVGHRPLSPGMVLFTFELVYLALWCFDHTFAWWLCCCPWVLLCMCVYVCVVCLCSCAVMRVLCFRYSHSVSITRRLPVFSSILYPLTVAVSVFCVHVITHVFAMLFGVCLCDYVSRYLRAFYVT